MTNEDILYQAILQAEKNGYKEHLNYLPFLVRIHKNLNKLAKTIFYKYREQIIFSRSFAKAYFGEKDTVYSCKAWIRRLEEMSEQENEIQYLKRFLKCLD